MFSSNTSQVAAAAQAEAIDYDGTNDYLSRSTDLTGNTDTNQMTFSAWMYWDGSSFGTVQNILGLGRLRIFGWNTTPSFITIEAQNSSSVNILSARVEGSNVLTGLQKSWVSFIISFDLSNTSKRSCYINDQLVSVSWLTYTSDSIDTFITGYPIAVARDNGQYGGVQFYKGRLSNVYLDYTYRDLSVTANRRLFVTADLKPAAGQAALNPLIYLPMNDPTAPGTNAGTGGNFTLTGTVARSGRGPNQYNAPYSDLDGTADYLDRTTAPTGITDGKAFTLHFVAAAESAGRSLLTFATSTTNRFHAVYGGNANILEVVAANTAGTQILFFTVAGALVSGRNRVVTMSIDLSDVNKRHVYINGTLVSPTWTTYTNDTIDFAITSTPRYRVGCNAGTTPANFFDGRLGALWFDTSYIDLSVASNLAKFVTGTGIDAKPVDLGASGELPTGTSPIIYLPMYGNNAGKNYGTGGDFTVNSGPYTGARGPNEFWGNIADFDGTTGRLSRTSGLVGIADGKTFSSSFWLRADTLASLFYFTEATGGVGSSVYWYVNTAGNLFFNMTNASGVDVCSASIASAIVANQWYYITINVDLTNAANRSVYINGSAASVTWSVYTNQNMDLTTSDWTIGSGTGGSSPLNGKLSEFYFTTEYIDFSLESNRLKFRDAFGNPTDLPAAIAAQSIPNPAIYMRFDPASFGTNSGTGGNFTVNGTISDGGQL